MDSLKVKFILNFIDLKKNNDVVTSLKTLKRYLNSLLICLRY